MELQGNKLYWFYQRVEALVKRFPQLVSKCNNDIQSSPLNLKLKGQWPLGQLLSIAHRTVRAKFDHFKQRFSPRKLIPINVETLGDYLLLKRIEASLSQPQLTVKSGATLRKVKAWEHDKNLPTEVEWKLLVKIL